MEISDVYTPSEWGAYAWFYDGIEDKKQRRALALIGAFGSPGGGDRVCFVGDCIAIAAPEQPPGCGIELAVRQLDEFIENFSMANTRDADPMALRWVEDIVNENY